MENTPKFKTLFLVSSIAVAILSLAALADLGMKVVTSDIIDQHSKDIAEVQLHLACWAKSGRFELERQLPEYIYCKYGAVSMKEIAK